MERLPVTPTTNGYTSGRALLKHWLKTVIGYENVTYTHPTNLNFLMPLVVVDRFGGADTRLALDVCHLDVDVFAPDDDTAEAHSETIRQAMRMRLPGFIYNDRAVVNQVKTISAPTRAQWDSRNQVRRYTAAYQVTIQTYGGI